MKKEGSRRKITFEKKSLVRVCLSHPGLARFLHWPVFCLTRTGPATWSTRQAGPSLITKVVRVN
jgi:hypothetical protein